MKPTLYFQQIYNIFTLAGIAIKTVSVRKLLQHDSIKVYCDKSTATEYLRCFNFVQMNENFYMLESENFKIAVNLAESNFEVSLFWEFLATKNLNANDISILQKFRLEELKFENDEAIEAFLSEFKPFQIEHVVIKQDGGISKYSYVYDIEHFIILINVERRNTTNKILYYECLVHKY